MDKVKGVVSENDYISLVADFTKDRDNLIKEKEELIKIINNQKPQIDETAKIEKLAKLGEKNITFVKENRENHAPHDTYAH